MFNKYRELGLALIPLYKNDKNPIMREWSQYCERLPTEEECELWDRHFKAGGKNVGLCLGPSSGVCGVDIDSDDIRLHKIAPVSPVRKRGETGETRFFKWNQNITIKHLCALDILSIGSQTVLPPSIHPVTKLPYVWITPDTLENFSVSDLPELSLDWIPEYVKLAEQIHPDKKKGEGGVGGRNNWLVSIVWAKLWAGESEADIVSAVYGIDRAKNEKRLFTDADEGYKAQDENKAFRNAWEFVNSVTASFIKKGDGPNPRVRLPEVLVLGKKNPIKFTPKDYPEPQGTLGTIYKTALAINYRKAKAFSLGGSIAIASPVVANRYIFKKTWPNIYILNVGPTSAGKDAVQELSKELLARALGAENLYGHGNYSSSVAISKGLEIKRERLDVIDEASSLFNKISQGGSHQTDIDDTLCTLYSSSKTLYVGPEAMSRDGIRVWHPCVSILMSTTLDGLVGSISKQIATKGFFPRCLLFVEYDYSEQQNPDEDTSQQIIEISRIMRDIRAMECPQVPGDLMNRMPYPKEIPCDREALEFLETTRFNWGEQVSDPKTSLVNRIFLGKAGEQAKKLALIHGAMRGGTIQMLDVEWAIEVVNTMRFNASSFFPQLTAENKTHANFERVFSIISSKGIISNADLLAKTRFLTKRERNEVTESLIEEELIQKDETDKGWIWSIN